MRTHDLELLADTFAVCRLPAGAELGDAVLKEPWVSVTHTRSETSVVLHVGSIHLLPPERVCEYGWRALKVRGPLAFDEVGVMSSLVGPLAASGLSTSVLSTYETDYLFVKDDVLERATRVLEGARHTIHR